MNGSTTVPCLQAARDVQPDTPTFDPYPARPSTEYHATQPHPPWSPDHADLEANSHVQAMTTVPAPDQSGRRSRGGYKYQDLCALRYCIRIARDSTWDEVQCESHEDIVLTRIRTGIKTYRFVQVKFEFSAHQHWSCSMLCSVDHAKKTKSITDSVIVKLFDSDQLGGEPEFRLAVNEGVSRDLAPFHYKWNHDEPTIDPQCKEAKALTQRLQAWSPSNGKSVSYFLERFAIEQHAADNSDMEASILQELTILLADHGVTPLVDELTSVFQSLYSVVFKAASAPPGQTGHPERISGSAFREASITLSNVGQARTQQVASSSQSATLRAELESIGLPEIIIANAIDLRREFYALWRASSGTEHGKALDQAYLVVKGICTSEMVRTLEDPTSAGKQLHRRIIERIEAEYVQGTWSNRNVSLSTMLNGILFYLIGRNSLRFYL